MWLLEIDDTQIRLWRDREIVYAQPGAAFVGKSSLDFGHEALKQSRIDPSRIHSHYWHNISHDDITPSIRGAANQADLVYQHVQEVVRDHESAKDGMFVAIASDMTHEQIGLLYGVLQGVGVNVIDFIDYSTALASSVPLPSEATFIDLQMHRSVFVDIVLDGANVRRSAVTSIPGLGLNTLLDRWVFTVAQKSLETSRFDPRAFGSTEQQVFDQIYSGIERYDETLEIVTEHASESRRLELKKVELESTTLLKLADFDTYLRPKAPVVVRSATLALPGIRTWLQQREHAATVVQDASLVDVVRSTPAKTNPDGVERTLHTVFEHREQAIDNVQRSDVARPTHLLHGSTAESLGSLDRNSSRFHFGDHTVPFRFVGRGPDVQLEPVDGEATYLNGRVVTHATAVGAGDVIAHGTREYRLITVHDNG